MTSAKKSDPVPPGMQIHPTALTCDIVCFSLLHTRTLPSANVIFEPSQRPRAEAEAMQFVNLSVGRRHDGLTVVGAVDPVLRRLSALLEADPLALLLLLLLRLGRRLQSNDRKCIKICPYV